MNISGLQIFPFDEDQKFEQFIEDLFNALNSTQSFSHFGTGGQSQYGIDIYSIEHKIAIQCKLKDVTSSNHSTIKKRLIKDFIKDFDEFSKYNLSIGNKFSKYIFTSTFKDDADISKLCIEKSNEDLIVEYWGWSKIKNSITSSIFEKHFKELLELYDKFYNQDEEYLQSKIEIYDNEIINLFEEPLVKFKQGKVLDSLYDIFEAIIYNEISFIPPHIITKYFLSNFSDEVYSDGFKLTIKNEELNSFFNSFTVENKNTIVSDVIVDEEEIKKLEVILQKLSNNLFFYLSIENKQIDIRFHKHIECDCVHCKYENYDFSKINFQVDENEKEDLDKLFLKAYVNYKIGNYKNSLLIYIRALELAKQNKKVINIFFISYNILRLKQLLNGRIFGKTIDVSKLFDFSTINLDEQYCLLSKHPHKETVNWLHSQKFYLDAFKDISTLSKQLSNHYKNSISNGYGFNGYVNSIIHSFFSYNLFLQNNFLIFDCFSEHTEIIELFTEGLFASHAIKSERNSKLNGFDDYILKILLDNSKPDTLIKLFREYNLKELVYLKSETDENKSFSQIILKIISNYNSIVDFQDNLDEENDVFLNKYKKYVLNGIVLSAQLNIEKEEVNLIFKEIICVVKSNKQKIDLKYLSYIIRKKGSLLSSELYLELIDVIISNSFYNDSRSLEDLVYAIHNSVGTISFNKELSSKIITFLRYKKSKPIYRVDTNILVDFYLISDSKTKKKISTICNNILKASFDPNFYFNCIINDVIKLDSADLDIYISLSFPDEQKIVVGRPVYELSNDNNNSKLDDLFNILFKFEIDLSDSKFDFINRFSSYYQWLKDLDGFDYNKFNPNWITLYTTRFYFRAFFKSKSLKNELDKYFKSESLYDNKEIMECYFNIYTRKIWDTDL